MCGLVGILRRDQRAIDPIILRRMTASLAHRGPDGEGIWIDGHVGLGHRRLAVIDPGPASAQPMHTADGRYTVVYNGMLYNFRELREQLTALGHVFRTDGDTEVVLLAFAEWQRDAFARFNGMFAIAIWDRDERLLWLARDRYGIKPLYVADSAGTLLFGSEIKAFLPHPEFRVRVDRPGLQEYFTFQNILSARTLFEGVEVLAPGQVWRIDAHGGGSPVRSTYWDYHFTSDPTIDHQTAVDETERLVERAVERQLVSDVPIGAYLSGGLDSGAITGIASRRLPHVRSFTCGFDLTSASGMELNYDERAKAEYMSYLYGTEHYQVVLKAGDMERVMPELIWHLEDPRVGQCYPNYYVARLASRFVKVVLTGTGSDELFAGYPWRYYAVTRDPRTVDEYVALHYAYWQRLVPDDTSPRLLRPSVLAATDPTHPLAAFRSIHAHLFSQARTTEDFVNLSLYFEIKTFLRGLLTVEDKLSMAHGLEARTPFLDNDLVDFAQRIPLSYKLRNLQPLERIDENTPGRKDDQYYRRTSDGKLILREVLARFVPETVTHAAKQGFSAPDGSWFKGESMDYIKRLLAPETARLYAYLDTRVVQSLLDQHIRGVTNRRLFIWSCICFEWWLRIFEPVS